MHFFFNVNSMLSGVSKGMIFGLYQHTEKSLNLPLDKRWLSQSDCLAQGDSVNVHFQPWSEPLLHEEVHVYLLTKSNHSQLTTISVDCLVFPQKWIIGRNNINWAAHIKTIYNTILFFCTKSRQINKCSDMYKLPYNIKILIFKLKASEPVCQVINATKYICQANDLCAEECTETSLICSFGQHRLKITLV